MGRSLVPLTIVAQAVHTRTPSTLDPLPVAGLPEEVLSLVTALNALLQRLATALTAQRALLPMPRMPCVLLWPPYIYRASC